MSVRLISKTGQTASLSIGHPAVNMKWIVKWALVVLHTSATSGTRNASLAISRANAGLSSALCGGQNEGGTSSNFFFTGDVTGLIPSTSGVGTIWSQFPEVFAIDVIFLNVTLVSGDTVDYYILVEEASS